MPLSLEEAKTREMINLLETEKTLKKLNHLKWELGEIRKYIKELEEKSDS